MAGSPPTDPPGCICGPWEDDGKGHWVRIVNEDCPVHGVPIDPRPEKRSR